MNTSVNANRVVTINFVVDIDIYGKPGKDCLWMVPNRCFGAVLVDGEYVVVRLDLGTQEKRPTVLRSSVPFCFKRICFQDDNATATFRGTMVLNHPENPKKGKVDLICKHCGVHYHMVCG